MVQWFSRCEEHLFLEFLGGVVGSPVSDIAIIALGGQAKWSKDIFFGVEGAKVYAAVDL